MALRDRPGRKVLVDPLDPQVRIRRWLVPLVRQARREWQALLVPLACKVSVVRPDRRERKA